MTDQPVKFIQKDAVEKLRQLRQRLRQRVITSEMREVFRKKPALQESGNLNGDSQENRDEKKIASEEIKRAPDVERGL